ncbi:MULTISPECIES: hypothetical protein [unclassified Leptolyngbya]|uniref:hypothetical protein n=1 Tax=unclassified Leptolyngbya TaxID=2650499 RepID=UPI001688FBA7|nr:MULTISPECIES: hypothetical protein [unclassified Leptolyngbya]MBD1911381.1 hypothetical protein [Leptolyngbya sp. FACHB-8]MBD2156601.1 hypothetical protein [Leptolyngbya sp. FACHB-16]
MEQRVGLIILGLVGAIALDGLYAVTTGRPWRLRQEVEIVPVSVQAGSADEQQLLDTLEHDGGQDIKMILTEPCNPANKILGWKIEAGGFLTPVAPMGCQSPDPDIADQIVVQ